MRRRLRVCWFSKIRRIGLFVVITGLLLAQSASYAQNQQLFNMIAPHAQNDWFPAPTAFHDDISPQQYARIQAELAHHRSLLAKRSKLHRSQQQTFVPFIFPLRLAPDAPQDDGFFTRAQFVDHNPAYPDQVLDYNRGDRTYDVASGYNHPGTDIGLWPFAWQKMDANAIQVVAAAAGTIILKEDGNPDRSCGAASTDANVLVIQNNDGAYTTLYAHLKAGSITHNISDTVAAGEYLGIVGSSGNSSGPHLHFEVRDASGQVVDPFFGPANTAIGKTLWDQQPDYYDAAINHLGTGTIPPVFPACPAPEISNEQTSFAPGSSIYFTSYYREQVPGQPSQFAIYRPDNSRFVAWTDAGAPSYAAASYGYARYTIPATEPEGTWRFEVTYRGRTYQHAFVIRALSPPSPTVTPLPGPPKFTVFLPVINQ